MGFLIGIYTSVVKMPSGRFVLRNLNRRVREVLELTRLANVMTIYANEEAALRALQEGQKFSAPKPADSVDRYFLLGGYFSIDFFTMLSSLPCSLVASRFSSVAMARHTNDRVAGIAQIDHQSAFGVWHPHYSRSQSAPACRIGLGFDVPAPYLTCSERSDRKGPLFS